MSGEPPSEGNLTRDIKIGISPRQPIRRFLRRSRIWVDQYPRLRWAYRLGVALLGTLIVIVGLILVPLPGPGWLIVFLGLATLGTEFPAAARFGAYARRVVTKLWHRWRDRKATDSA